MLRWLIALPLSGVCVFALFSVMATMVGRTSLPTDGEPSPLAFDIVMAEQESDAQRRQRSLPEKPEPPEMPKAQATQAATPAQSSLSLMPELALDTGLNGIDINTPSLGDMSSFNVAANQQAMPLFRVEPSYPVKALKRGIEGYVVIAFTIDPAGRPQDLKVVEAKPRRTFERDAKRALKKWKYQPKLVNGKAVAQPGQTVKLEFTLNQ